MVDEEKKPGEEGVEGAAADVPKEVAPEVGEEATPGGAEESASELAEEAEAGAAEKAASGSAEEGAAKAAEKTVPESVEEGAAGAAEKVAPESVEAASGAVEKTEPVGEAALLAEELEGPLELEGEMIIDDFLREVMTMQTPEEAIARPIQPFELEHLLQKYAFLVIRNADTPEAEALGTPKIVPDAPKGWIVQDFGDVIRTAPGRGMFTVREGEEDEGGGGMGPTNSSIAGELIELAEFIVDMAHEKNKWSKAEIVDGYRGMEFAAYLHSLTITTDFELVGFEPTEVESIALDRIQELKGFVPETEPPKPSI